MSQCFTGRAQQRSMGTVKRLACIPLWRQQQKQLQPFCAAQRSGAAAEASCSGIAATAKPQSLERCGTAGPLTTWGWCPRRCLLPRLACCPAPGLRCGGGSGPSGQPRRGAPWRTASPPACVESRQGWGVKNRSLRAAHCFNGKRNTTTPDTQGGTQGHMRACMRRAQDAR